MDDAEILTAQQEAAKLAAIEDERGMRYLMGSGEGRRMIWKLIEIAGVYRGTFHTDRGVMSYLEGKRAQGLLLLDLIGLHCPEQYEKMRQENLATTDTTGNETP